MQKVKWILPLLMLAVMLGGCPYGSEFPIDQPTVKIDEKLLGKWEPKSTSDYIYDITKEDAFNYMIIKKNKTSTSDKTVYRAYLSKLGNDTFINLYEDAASLKTYYFYKVSLSGSGVKITLSPVTENIDEKFKTSDELKAFFLKYKDLSFFFSKDEEEYIKAD